ncbi:glycerophosphodiester phosphodiesterase family protein [Pleomorphovibrio marinus]|uniref:glycerophosphodiester phosphodiesterase family protein n=1 Tax=Pleomorphovibrio marinus TaxID=2164132 RepID=UPI000E0AFA74|nr:glycerophosphodiester phosphodiesterase family protein [Pleomorphovibrio marinus]
MNKFVSAFWVFLFIACSSCDDKRTEVDQLDLHRISLKSTEEAKKFFSWSADRVPMVSAHRGGPYPGYPENSIEAFEHVLEHTHAIIEFDVAITKDSVLILMHDNTLDRTTTGSGEVRDYTFKEIQELYLVDREGDRTEFRVPTFEDALEWGRGKTVFTVDIKREVPFEKVVEAIQKYHAHSYAAVITYNVAAAKKVHQLDPDLMLSLTIRNEEELRMHEDSGIPVENWIAFTGTSERPEAFNRLLHGKGVFTILGVIGNLDRRAEARGDATYLPYIKRGADILATDRPIEAAKALIELIPENSKMKSFFD